MESHGHAEGHVGERGEEIVRVSSCVAQTTKDLSLGDRSHNAARVIFRAFERSLASLGMTCVRIWKARGRCERAPFLFRELPASDRGSVPHWCPSLPDASGER